jgi:hypothetical protein
MVITYRRTIDATVVNASSSSDKQNVCRVHTNTR